MKARFLRHRAIASSLPLLLGASAVVAAASCGSAVDAPSGAGGAGVSAGNVGPGPITTIASSSSGVVFYPDTSGGGGLETLKPSVVCKDCHASIYNDWAPSMHARSITGPVAIAQMNQIYKLELKDKGAPDPQRLCVQCHSPISAAFAGAQVELPFKQEGGVSPDALTEGVGCVTCHAYTGLPVVGAAALSDFLNDYDAGGFTYYGPIANPVDSPAHKSTNSGILGLAPETMCINCHNVFFDTSQDGKVVAGEDIILQNTSFEHDELYRKVRDETCIDCHMPQQVNGPVADGPAAPPGVPQDRERHRHSFTGADFPIDDADNDVQLGLRQELLKQAATMEVLNPAVVNGSQVTFSVNITNTKAGHNLPTGFAFLRQMWVEVRIVGALSNVELASSGLLKAEANDLCDAGTLSEPLSAHVQGCLVQGTNQADPQLVNFQMKLVTDIDQAIVNGVPVAVQAAAGQETSFPIVEGGQVARVRPVDQGNLAPLAPFESRSFGYSFTFPPQQDGVRLEVALRFRGLPPYLMRALAEREPSLAQRLTQNLGKLKPITIVKVQQNL